MLEVVAAFLVKTTVILGMANGVCSIRGLSAAERHAAACIGVLGVAMIGAFVWLPAWSIAVPGGLVPGEWANPAVGRPLVVAGSMAASEEGTPPNLAGDALGTARFRLFNAVASGPFGIASVAGAARNMGPHLMSASG